MSQNIGEINGLVLANMGPGREPTVSVTRFWGGAHRTCVQLTIGGRFVQLDQEMTGELIKRLQCATNNGHKYICTYCGQEHGDNEC